MLTLGQWRWENPVFSAPMAGVTDAIFRQILHSTGAELTYTEMINARGLVENNRHTWDLLKLDPEQGVVAVQLFGKSPSLIAQAAVMAVDAGAAIIDLNMGCPTRKIVNNGEGCALMLNPALAGEIVAAVSAAVNVPVTIKMRKGWGNEESALAVATAVAQAGAGAVTVHGRTRDQFYSGKADWQSIAIVKQNLSIPVIGNGDIWEPEDAAAMMEATGCDAVMIGRGALGNPWIFPRTRCYLGTGQLLPPPGLQAKLSMMRQHLTMQVAAKGEALAVKQMRKHLGWYLKGFPEAATWRVKLQQLSSYEEAGCLLNEINDRIG